MLPFQKISCRVIPGIIFVLVVFVLSSCKRTPIPAALPSSLDEPFIGFHIDGTESFLATEGYIGLFHSTDDDFTFNKKYDNNSNLIYVLHGHFDNAKSTDEVALSIMKHQENDLQFDKDRTMEFTFNNETFLSDTTKPNGRIVVRNINGVIRVKFEVVLKSKTGKELKIENGNSDSYYSL